MSKLAGKDGLDDSFSRKRGLLPPFLLPNSVNNASRMTGCALSVFGVEPFRIGGTEAFAREVSLQLGEKGWRSVLCFLTEPTQEVRNFLELPNVTIEVVPNFCNGNWQGLSELRRVLSRHKPDLLHLHFVGFLSLYPWLGKLTSVKKIFFTDHSSRPGEYQPKRAPFWKRALSRAINGPLTRVFSVSNYGLRCIQTVDALPAERFELIYNGVDIARIVMDPEKGQRFRDRFSIPSDRAVVLQVSWIIPEKGIGDLLQAARAVLEKIDKVQFVFVGEGPHRTNYMKEAEQLGIADHVTWAGLIEDPIGEGVYDAADVICQLSRWEEVFGWMIAEAMVYGKPVVASNVGGIPELVAHGESGFLVERGDATAAANYILELLKDKDLRNRMGSAGRARACSRFDLRTNVRQLLRFYDK